MNVNEISAASGYAQMNSLEAKGGMKQLAESFAATFDKADDAAKDFAAEKIDTQAVVEAFSQAELALQTAITMRDRVVAAYQEILRMPI